MDGQIETQTRRENKHDELQFGADNELRTGVESDLLGVVKGNGIVGRFRGRQFFFSPENLKRGGVGEEKERVRARKKRREKKQPVMKP